jgi:hypothetical protein
MTLTLCLEQGKPPVPVTSLKEASQLVQAFISRTGYGSTDFYAYPLRGTVYSEGSTLVARVSYNGRVWDAEDRTVILEV